MRLIHYGDGMARLHPQQYLADGDVVQLGIEGRGSPRQVFTEVDGR